MDPELELFLYRLGEMEFRAVIRLRFPPMNVDDLFEAEPIRIDLAAFNQDDLTSNPPQYGLQLGRCLFDHPAARRAFDEATAVARAAGAAAQPPVPQLPVRVRLCTDQRSLKLHRLRWETLRIPSVANPADPGQAERLGANRNWVFSRHLFSGDMRPIRLRPQSDLTALIAIASPSDISAYAGPAGRPLPSISVTQELETAEYGLQQLNKDRLIPELSPGGRRVTLARLLEALRKEPDVLYLVCHGALVDGEPRLLLEQDNGNGQVVSGTDLVRELKTLRNLPRLVVLISCQGAGTVEEPSPAERTVLSALGPRLAEAGVPAVLAMQGDLDMRTARDFLPPFFQTLQSTGQVDAAVTIARAAVQDRPDGWVPVLFTRLVEGRLWYRKGVVSASGFAWGQLAMDINQGKCVPILGAAVLEPFLGSTRMLANQLATEHGYPLALSGREDLPEVAQFLETMRPTGSPNVQVLVANAMAEAVRQKYPELGLGPVSKLDPGGDLRTRLTDAWRIYQKGRLYEPHAYLAGVQQIRTIITTNPDDLMEEALTSVGRAPCRHLFRWEDDANGQQSPPAAPTATPERPNVFHLMGHLSDLDSMIVTEDEYFQFLTAYTRRQSETKGLDCPADVDLDTVRAALAKSTLLFLGFRITDWDFRTLCRLLIDQSGKKKKRIHVLVQIDPEDGTHGDAVRARDFIVRLFEDMLARPPDTQVAVFWGSVEDFFEELDKQWQQLKARV